MGKLSGGRASSEFNLAPDEDNSPGAGIMGLRVAGSSCCNAFFGIPAIIVDFLGVQAVKDRVCHQ